MATMAKADHVSDRLQAAATCLKCVTAMHTPSAASAALHSPGVRTAGHAMLMDCCCLLPASHLDKYLLHVRIPVSIQQAGFLLASTSSASWVLDGTLASAECLMQGTARGTARQQNQHIAYYANEGL